MLLAKDLPKSLWAEAVNTAVYVLNRSCLSGTEEKTPYELFTGRSAHIEKFHIFDEIEEHSDTLNDKPLPDSLKEIEAESAGASAKPVESLTRELRDRSTLKPPVRYAEANLLEVDAPRSYNEAVQSAEKAHWQEAMQEEMTSLKENLTWILVKMPAGRKPITNRWMYSIKRKTDGEISRYKARLVVRSFMLSIAANEHLELAQFDVKTAFVNGVIEEEIYMMQPEGFDDNSGRVCKLQKKPIRLKTVTEMLESAIQASVT
ncbi:gag-pol polyprotein [Lasius niger]|uniref:Gag-pol polyprotein n=1 Tax=Lasius niger TaxID=67767 RepID=A0A0J7KB43_LASNI|nr:gag-pol polyprotein [Lasius niger]